MKTYSIGRDLNCDIVINDSTDVISRRHALLNVSPSGKMTIIDQSSNGTYVNGIRINPNVPVPITRKDNVSLAHVAKLDWNQIPKSNKSLYYFIGIMIIIAVLVGIFVGVKTYKDNRDKYNPNGNGNTTELIDSALIKQKEAARIDSIMKASQQDSIKRATEKAKQDSIEAAEKEKGNKSGTEKKAPNDSKKNDKNKDEKEDKSEKKKNRAIG